jgi:nitrite reductase/ring-hydroxylating ferredoxin subunit
MSCPHLSRRALGSVTLTAAAGGTLAACGPDDEGFGTRTRVSASEDEIPLTEVPENTTTLVNFGGQQPYVALVRGSGDEVTAMSGYCTHQGCALALTEDGVELDCPCHGSAFDATTGDVLSGPASVALSPVEIEVTDDSVRRVR